MFRVIDATCKFLGLSSVQICFMSVPAGFEAVHPTSFKAIHPTSSKWVITIPRSRIGPAVSKQAGWLRNQQPASEWAKLQIGP